MNIPFNVSYHFDENLHEVPNAPDDMKAAIAFLQDQLDQTEATEKLTILGLIGSYSRILKEFETARGALNTAIALSQTLGSAQSELANQIRLAHVEQWHRNFENSDRTFAQIVDRCQNFPELSHYLDFAYQHAGKNFFDQSRYFEAYQLFEKALKLRQLKGDSALIESTQLALDATRNRLISYQF